MNGKQNFVVSRERDYLPFPVLWHGAESLLKQAAESPIGATWKCMGSLALLAFAIEGFTNTEGPKVFGDAWSATDRKPAEREPMSWKFKRIGKHYGVPIDYGVDPWTAVKRVLEERDWLAHPKPDNRSFGPINLYCHEDEVDSMLEEAFMEDHERLLRVETLAATFNMVKRAMQAISEAAYGHAISVFVQGGAVTSIQGITPE